MKQASLEVVIWWNALNQLISCSFDGCRGPGTVFSRSMPEAADLMPEGVRKKVQASEVLLAIQGKNDSEQRQAARLSTSKGARLSKDWKKQRNKLGSDKRRKALPHHLRYPRLMQVAEFGKIG